MEVKISEADFREQTSKYYGLGEKIVQSMQTLLKDKEISFLDVYFRIKTYESFVEKVQRKGYKSPFEENEDFCGIRVICYFPSDINEISEMISEEFCIISSEDKSEINVDRFGYRSYHFVVTIKPEWTVVPNFRGLENLKIEIQVRTILMHAWADIEHKLQYKKKEHIPRSIQRKFYQLSALFELADEQLEGIRDRKERIYSELSEVELDKTQNVELNLDSLQALLDKHYPDKQNIDNLKLLDELLEWKINLNYVEDLLQKSKELIIATEKGQKTKLYQAGVVRHLLDIFNDEYWESRKGNVPEFIVEQVEHFREKYR